MASTNLEIEFNLAELEEELEETKEAIISKQELVKQQILEKFGEISSATNSSSTKKMFQGRINFKKVFNDFQKNTIDIWYHSPLYGKISLHGLVASVENNPLTDELLKEFLGLGDETEEIGCEPIPEWWKKDSPMLASIKALLGDSGRETIPLFIVAAWMDASAFFQTRLINKNSLIKEIKIVKGYDRRNDLFVQNLNEIYESFLVEKLSAYENSGDLADIEDFYELLKRFLEGTGNVITFSGFMESKLTTPYSSGLVYDLFDADLTSDREKIQFYEDPNFDFFKYVLTMHGFKIDPNIPWRAIADITSDKMWPYISKWQLPYMTTKAPGLAGPCTTPKDCAAQFNKVNIREVYSQLFVPYANYNNFRAKDSSFATTIKEMYLKFLAKNPTYSKTAGSSIVYIKRSPLNEKTLEKKWMRWYAEIRNIEKGRPLGFKQLKKIATKAHHIYLLALKNEDKKLTSAALQYVEYALGPLGLGAADFDKRLTVREENIIMIPGLIGT